MNSSDLLTQTEVETVEFAEERSKMHGNDENAQNLKQNAQFIYADQKIRTVSNTNLIIKLIAVYEAIDHVEKRGQNKFQNYAYVKASDIARAIRDALKKQGIFACPKFSITRTYTIPTKNEGEMQAVDVTCEVKFIDSETGTEILVNGFGSGTDKGDKAVYKAQTGAMKYALRSAFLIPDESDPEADEEVDRQTLTRSQSEQRSQHQEAPKQQTSSFPAQAAQNKPSNTPPIAFPAVSSHSVDSTAVPSIHKSGIMRLTPTESTTLVDPNVVPTRDQYDAYIAKAIALTEQLEKAGLKSGRGLPAKTKLKRYIFHVCQVEKLEDLKIGQWDLLFTEFEKLLAADSKHAVELVENANVKEATNG